MAPKKAKTKAEKKPTQKATSKSTKTTEAPLAGKYGIGIGTSPNIGISPGYRAF